MIKATTQSADAATPQGEESNSPTVKDKLNELDEKLTRTELQIKEERLNNKQQWLSNMVYFLTLLVTAMAAVVAVVTIVTYMYAQETKENLQETKKNLNEAKEILREINQHIEEAEEITKRMEAYASKKPQKNPEGVKRIIDILEGQNISQLDSEIVEATKLQIQEQYDKSIDKWLAIAKRTEDNDKETAAKAYFSAAYLIGEYNDKYKEKDESTVNEVLDLYSKSIELHPTASAYYNRGAVKSMMGWHLEALADFKKVLELEPRNEEDKKAIAAARQAIAEIEARGKND